MPSPERILLYGIFGTGKTYQVLKTAQWLQASGAQFYILDTDDSYERSLDEFPGLTNVHIKFGYNWADYIQWHDEVKVLARPWIDWIVVDRADKAWAQVQRWFSEEVYGKSLAERTLEARKASAKKKAMLVTPNDQADWLTINANYMEWFMGLMYGMRTHVLLVTAVDKLHDKDSEELKRIYTSVGANPAGQKIIGHEPHTVMFFWRDQSGGFHVRTLKDRGGRLYFADDPLVSLPHQYLMMRAKWTPAGMPGGSGLR